MRRAIPIVRAGLTGAKADAFFFATPVAAGANFVFSIRLIASLAIPIVAITRLIPEKILIAGITMPGRYDGMRTFFAGGIHAFFRLCRFACGTIAVRTFRTVDVAL